MWWASWAPPDPRQMSFHGSARQEPPVAPARLHHDSLRTQSRCRTDTAHRRPLLAWWPSVLAQSPCPTSRLLPWQPLSQSPYERCRGHCGLQADVHMIVGKRQADGIAAPRCSWLVLGARVAAPPWPSGCLPPERSQQSASSCNCVQLRALRSARARRSMCVATEKGKGELTLYNWSGGSINLSALPTRNALGFWLAGFVPERPSLPMAWPSRRRHAVHRARGAVDSSGHYKTL